MNLTFCIILSLRPRELEMCHRNKPRIKYSRSKKMFSPDFQNWSFSKKKKHIFIKILIFINQVIYVRLHKLLWCSLGMTTIIEGGKMLRLHGR